jgi:hypothetical protein
MTPETAPLFCELTVMPEGGQEQVTALAERLLPGVDEVRELPDGYALAFHDASADLISDLAAFVALDRLCCAFLRHAVVSEPGSGTVWLELTGQQGAKEAIAATVDHLLPHGLSARDPAAAGIDGGG